MEGSYGRILIHLPLSTYLYFCEAPRHTTLQRYSVVGQGAPADLGPQPPKAHGWALWTEPYSVRPILPIRTREGEERQV